MAHLKYPIISWVLIEIITLLSKNGLLYHSYRKEEKEERSNRNVMRNMLGEKKSVMS